MNTCNISDAELDIIKILWSSEKPLSTQEICDEISERTWKYSTVATFLNRMVDKGAIAFEKQGKLHYYRPLLEETNYKAGRARQLVQTLYDGSVKNMVASLVEQQALSHEELTELRTMFELEE